MKVRITKHHNGTRTIHLNFMTEDEYRRVQRIIAHAARGVAYDGESTRHLAAQVDTKINPETALKYDKVPVQGYGPPTIVLPKPPVTLESWTEPEQQATEPNYNYGAPPEWQMGSIVDKPTIPPTELWTGGAIKPGDFIILSALGRSEVYQGDNKWWINPLHHAAGAFKEGMAYDIYQSGEWALGVNKWLSHKDIPEHSRVYGIKPWVAGPAEIGDTVTTAVAHYVFQGNHTWATWDKA